MLGLTASPGCLARPNPASRRRRGDRHGLKMVAIVGPFSPTWP